MSYIDLIPWIFGVVFAAGLLVARDQRTRKDLDGGFRQIRSDLNGIGARMREDAKRLQDEHYNLVLALMVIVEKPEHRLLLARMLRR